MTVGPDYETPDTDLPAQWRKVAPEAFKVESELPERWWSTFNDPVLDSLIERARAGNLTLQEAYARIKEARAFLGVARGERLPAIDGTGSVERFRASEGIFQQPLPPASRTDTFRGTGFDATWEIDFFGRISRQVEAAGADFEASIEDYRDILVVLYGDIATTYTNVRTLQERIRITEKNVETQRDTLRIVRLRRDAELAPDLDVEQAKLILATTESNIPQLRAALVANINRLSVLLGQPPSALHAELSVPKPIPMPPIAAQVTQPANLLRQRPDIRRAERLLAAQTARVGAATADLYPRFSLSGVFAFQTVSGSLYEWDNHAFSFGPSFRWNIFDGGRVRSFIDAQDARTEAALKSYENTVLLAMDEVETAITAYTQEGIRKQALVRSVVAAQRSVDLVLKLYRTGLTNFLNVLDMERSLFAQEDSLADSQGLISLQLIRVYTALGGGWNPQAERTQEQEKQSDKQPLTIFGVDLPEVPWP